MMAGSLALQVPAASAIDKPTTHVGTPSDSTKIRQGAVSDSIGAPIAPEAVPPAPPVLVPGPPPHEPPAPRNIVSIRATGFANVDSMVIIKTFGLQVNQTYSPESVREGVR